MSANDTYEAFQQHVQRLTYVQDAAGLLQWDQQVMMPEGGTPARSKQQSALSAVSHEMLTDDDLADYLDDLEGADLDPAQQAVVREVRREHERASRVPEDLVQRLSEATSEGLPVWEQAREEDDFGRFEDTLEELVDLRREYAEAIDPDRDPYEVLFEEYEPYLGVDTAERVLEQLAEELPPLIDAVGDSDVDLADPFPGAYDEADQEALVRAALETLGYDFERGRLDTSTHPFTSGTQFDARVTTRFDPEDPLDALGSTVHEFESRFWENHVGRSEPFWELVTPHVAEHLGVDASPRAFYEAANEVYDDNPIRVEADELTYHMHILVRFEIERDLVRGDLDVAEVPAVWNDRTEEYLGFRPDTDAEGCLQDIHWVNGAFGYFPTYTLGSVLAAQIDAAVREDLALDERVRAGEFDPVREWLREHVHSHGARYRTDELVERATGDSFTADYFLEYVGEKYGALYGV